jgi:cyclic pyranopterin monophosphate synthase
MTGKKTLTHFDSRGQAHMVNTATKPVTERKAIAKGRVYMGKETLSLIQKGRAKKGDVVGVARIAGIMAAKGTSNLIPLCHPLPINAVTIEFSYGKDHVEITATCSVSGQTGVEMEALCAVSVSALTLYDMIKAVDKKMVIGDIRLIHKSGGRSGTFNG